MKHLGLFEGIGGFSLAARWMGWETLAWCEWNEFGQKVLKHHFPEAEGFGDIVKTDFTKYANRIDVLTGGFPCQPYSIAGERKGKKDERHLWPEMLRAIREIQPCWVVGENVRGLINWSGGLVFDEIQNDLEAQGYEVFPVLLPAFAKNADHERYRIWFIAYSAGARLQRCINEGEVICNIEKPALSINSYCDVFERGNGFKRYSKYIRIGNGVSRRLDKHRIKSLGNAIVPQVAFEIFKAIEKYEHANQ